MNQNIWMKTMTQDRPQSRLWALPGTSSNRRTRPYELATLVDGFTPINLKEMDSVTLLNRTDTKFLMTNEQIFKVLPALQQDYRILSVDSQRLNHYRTLYFDTADFRLYNLHVNERADRYKVRSREYMDSGQSYLEVKHKTRKDRTIKQRIPTSRQVVQMNIEDENWVNSVLPYDSHLLEPKIWNTFTRITLVSIKCCERVTLDLDLSFSRAGKVVNLGGMVIAEAKTDSAHQESPFLVQIRSQRIHPQGFSKYCIGVAMLYDQVKKNALKPKMLRIKKMTRGLSYE